jgi:hypothetical protein
LRLNNQFSERSAIHACAFRGSPDDTIIIPLAIGALAVNKLMRFVVSVLVHIFDFAFPLAMQLVWLPLLGTRVLGDAGIGFLRCVLRILPVGEAKRRRWAEALQRNWTWLRERFSYRAFEHAVHLVFENGMAWVFRKCRHLTPGTALLVIIVALLWLPISFGAATALHAILFAKVASWPTWTQLLHPLATVIAKSKLLVLPVYPAAWPQAKRHPFIQIIFTQYQAIKDLHLVRKFGFRYRQTARVATAAVDACRRATYIPRPATWVRSTDNIPIEGQSIAHKPSQKVRLFYERWSIKFSAEYYEAKERQAAPPD